MNAFKSRIIKGMSANVITQGTSMVIQFSLIPVFLYFWGVELYGDWILLYSVPAYLSFVDLGFGITSSTLIAKSLSNSDYKEALKIFQSTLFITCMVGLIFILICLFTLQFLNISYLLGIHSFSPNEVSSTFFILVLYVVVGQQLGIFTGIYNYNNKYHFIANINSISRLVEFFGILLAVVFTQSILLVSLMMLIIKIFHVMLVVYDSIKLSPWMIISFMERNTAFIRSQLMPSLSLLLYPISFAILTQGISILIGTTLGNAHLVLFNTVRTFVNSIKTFASQINNLLLSELIKFFALNQILSAKRFYNRTTLYTTILIFVIGILLVLLGPLFISAWTGGELMSIPHVYIAFFIFEAITYNLWHANYQTYLAQNRHSLITVYFFVSSLVIIILTSIFLNDYGIYFFLLLSALANLMLSIFTRKNLFVDTVMPISSVVKVNYVVTTDDYSKR